MHNRLILLFVLSLGATAGCGSEAVTAIPDSVSATEIEQLEADQRRVDDEERQHLQQQRQQRRLAR